MNYGDPTSFRNFKEVMDRNIQKIKDTDKQTNNFDTSNPTSLNGSPKTSKVSRERIRHQK